VSGALLLTRSRFKVGDPVKLSLYILDDQNPRVVTGKIMRSERRGSDYSDVWPNSVGIKFDELLKDCEAEVKAVAEQQAKIGVSKTAP
jgi:Tfp pilus assembly protein PilZ